MEARSVYLNFGSKIAEIITLENRLPGINDQRGVDQVIALLISLQYPYVLNTYGSFYINAMCRTNFYLNFDIV